MYSWRGRLTIRHEKAHRVLTRLCMQRLAVRRPHRHPRIRPLPSLARLASYRHAALLAQAARLRANAAKARDPTLELERERVAGVVASVREAMARKGGQLAQLLRYLEQLG